MDTKQCIIVDLTQHENRRKFITREVASIEERQKGLWTVRFTTSPRVFKYNQSRLLYLTQPTTIDLSERGVYIRKKRISRIARLLQFTEGTYTFYHLIYENGFEESYDGQDVYVTRTPINQTGGSTWDYLLKLAAETGLTGENQDNILTKQYERVDLGRDNVPLAQYLGSRTELAVYAQPPLICYPFGCNASQKAAVEAALTHQVSLIQGPPGTGKTQTILNIIANLIISGKKVLIVSNNNAAVENVAEKLKAEGLDFIVARLGSAKNKEAFIANQPGYPDMTSWTTADFTDISLRTQTALLNVSQGFDSQTRLAQLKTEYDALLKETKYNEMLEKPSVQTSLFDSIPSARLMTLLCQYRRVIEQYGKAGLWFRLKWSFNLGFKMFSFLHSQTADVLATLESAYYLSRKAEIEQEMQAVSATLQSIDLEQNLKELRSSSLQLLKARIAQRYTPSQRTQFTLADMAFKYDDFMQEYPVVLSTTYSAKSCLNKDAVFDYVIMDEASQVDIKTGALALSCAFNAVIVGDDRQLPHVVSQPEALALQAIQATWHIDDRYNAVTHSFLRSCTEVFQQAPVTLLREHYRCHPLIIGFCNQQFYHGELIVMTTGHQEKNVLQVVRTAKGHHARGHFNQREIDVIAQEIIPGMDAESDSLGIITPYRLQAEKINQTLNRDIASTVHKFQGRECHTVIMSSVDNEPTPFSDDAHLLNVAISRAKNRLCIVTNGNDIPPESNLAQLIAYIQYHNFEIKESKLHSVFDLLYKQYTAERLAYESEHPAISEQLSENLVYHLLVQAFHETGISNASIICHYPLYRLIADWSLLSAEETVYAQNTLSHVDFLLYNSLTKRPLLVIEVDGWHFHQHHAAQQHRDTLKDQLLSKFGLCPYRISTTDTLNLTTIQSVLHPFFKSGNKFS